MSARKNQAKNQIITDVIKNKIVIEVLKKIQLDFHIINNCYPESSAILNYLPNILKKHNFVFHIKKTLEESMGAVFLMFSVSMLCKTKIVSLNYVFPIQDKRQGLDETEAFWQTVEFGMRALLGSIFLGEEINMKSINQCPIITAPYVRLLGSEEKRENIMKLIEEIEQRYV